MGTERANHVSVGDGEHVRLGRGFWRLAETFFLCEESPQSRDAIADARDGRAPRIRASARYKNRYLMSKMANASENHCHVALVSRGDDFIIAH